MAQTTTAFNASVAQVFLFDSPSYVDISGSSQSIDAVTAEIDSSETQTFDGDHPIILMGKFMKTEITVNILYTETANEAFDLVHTLWANKTATKVKWIPSGAGGVAMESLATGYIKSVNFPAIDASSADAVMASFVLVAPGIDYNV